MPFRFRDLFDILNGTNPNLSGDGLLPPPAGNVTVTIPRSWLVVGAMLIGHRGLGLQATGAGCQTWNRPYAPSPAYPNAQQLI